MHIHLYDSELNGGQGSSQTHLEQTIHAALSSPHELIALEPLSAGIKSVGYSEARRIF